MTQGEIGEIRIYRLINLINKKGGSCNGDKRYYNNTSCIHCSAELNNVCIKVSHGKKEFMARYGQACSELNKISKEEIFEALLL